MKCWVSKRVVLCRVIGTEATVHQLLRQEHTNLYFPMPASSLTEAFRSRTDGPAAFLPPAGCSGLQVPSRSTVFDVRCQHIAQELAVRCQPLQAPSAGRSWQQDVLKDEIFSAAELPACHLEQAIGLRAVVWDFVSASIASQHQPAARKSLDDRCHPKPLKLNHSFVW